MITPDDLVALVRNYNPNCDEDLIRRAWDYGAAMHEGQTRHSGEPYFTHPVAVASILTEMRLDDATIVTALLHDTVEDTRSTHAEVARLFGTEIAELVDGVTKLTNLQLSGAHSKQAENFRKLFMAMSRDLRVILVKLADRLHNMRTIKSMRPDKQQQKARADAMGNARWEVEEIGQRAARAAKHDIGGARQREHAEGFRHAIGICLPHHHGAGGGLQRTPACADDGPANVEDDIGHGRSRIDRHQHDHRRKPRKDQHEGERRLRQILDRDHDCAARFLISQPEMIFCDTSTVKPSSACAMNGREISKVRKIAMIFGTKTSVISCTCVSACKSAIARPTPSATNIIGADTISST